MMDEFIPYLVAFYGLFVVLIIVGIVLIVKKKNKIFGIILLILSFVVFSLGVAATAFGGLLTACGNMLQNNH